MKHTLNGCHRVLGHGVWVGARVAEDDEVEAQRKAVQRKAVHEFHLCLVMSWHSTPFPPINHHT